MREMYFYLCLHYQFSDVLKVICVWYWTNSEFPRSSCSCILPNSLRWMAAFVDKDMNNHHINTMGAKMIAKIILENNLICNRTNTKLQKNSFRVGNGNFENSKLFEGLVILRKNTQLSCFFSLLVFSLIFSCLPSSVLSLLLHLVSSFISDLLFFFFSGLFFHLWSCLVFSRLVSLSLFLSVSLCFCLSVSVSVWWCVVCGGVWCVVWHAEKTSVCRFNTSPCVPDTTPACFDTCGRGVGTHGDVLNLHTEVFWTDTRGGGRRGGSSSVLLAKICPQRVITCPRGSPKKRLRVYPFKVWEQVEHGTFPIPSIIRSTWKLFTFSCPEGHCGGNDKHNTPPTPTITTTTPSFLPSLPPSLPPLPPLPPTHTTHLHDHKHKHTHTKTHTKTTAYAHTNAHAHAYVYVHARVHVNVYVYVFVSVYEVLETATCSKKQHCGRSQASNSRYKQIVFTAQHSTAQRMTARRSVIHPSSCPSSVFVTVHQKKKKPKLINTGKSFWPFSRNSGSLTGSRLFLPELEVEIKNAGL